MKQKPNLQKRLGCGLLAWSCLVLAGSEVLAMSNPQWFVAKDGVIVEYLGPASGDIEFPAEIDGVPVTGIDSGVLGTWDLYDWRGWMYVPESVEWTGYGAMPGFFSGGRFYVPGNPTEFGDMNLGTGILTLDMGTNYTVFSDSAVVEESLSQMRGSVLVSPERLEGLIPIGGLYIDQGEVIHYEGRSSKVVIPQEYQGFPVTKIGDSAFFSNQFVEEVVLPSGLNVIGDSAFSHCVRLSQVNLPEGLLTLGDFSFYRCPLEEVTLPEGLLSIGMHCLSGGAFSSLVLPESLVDFGYGAVAYCQNLSDLKLSSKLETLVGPFEGCDQLRHLDIPEGIISLDYNFIESPSLERVSIPDSVVEIIGSEDVAEWGYMEKGWMNCQILASSGSVGQDYARERGLDFQAVD